MTVTSPAAPLAGAAPIAAPAGGSRDLRSLVALAVAVVARAYVSFAATLAVAALAPLLIDWNSYVVRSGSMEPDVSVGDVVVARPMAPSEDPDVGHVFVFEDPTAESGPMLVHRVVQRKEDGSWVTQGDANSSPDVEPAPRDAFHDRARILVPFIGRPVRWWRDGELLPLACWLVLTGAALAVLVAGRSGMPTGRRRGPRHGRGDPTGKKRRTRRRTTEAGGAVRSVTAVVGLAVLVAGPGISSASAGFTATNRNPGNAWSLAVVPVQRYSAEVLADDPYLYYLLDETSGTTTRDESDHGRHGSLSSIAGYRSVGALPNNFGYSMDLGSTGRVVSGGSGLSDPNTFSLELWFRTTTTAGGKLIGFESAQGGDSVLFDRHVTIRPDGRLVYGDWVAPQVRTISTPLAYNDGAWHHLVLTAAPAGNQQSAVMYVDGEQVASRTTTRTGGYVGWWRVGHGRVHNAIGLPTNAGFAGQVDQPAVYRSVLPPVRVRAHYAAR